jgi:hypothetical protein
MVFLNVDRVEMPAPTEPTFYAGILPQARRPCQIKQQSGGWSEVHPPLRSGGMRDVRYNLILARSPCGE